MNNYQMFKKIQEQAKVYKEYDNFDREDLIDELVEEKRINENDLELIDKYKEVLDKIKEYCKEEKEDLISGGEVCEDILELLEEIE